MYLIRKVQCAILVFAGAWTTGDTLPVVFHDSCIETAWKLPVTEWRRGGGGRDPKMGSKLEK